jgi:hypothetical protein
MDLTKVMTASEASPNLFGNQFGKYQESAESMKKDGLFGSFSSCFRRIFPNLGGFFFASRSDWTPPPRVRHARGWGERVTQLMEAP